MQLTANNPFYYGIDISTNRLSALPEDGVPVELSSVVRYDKGEAVVEEERES